MTIAKYVVPAEGLMIVDPAQVGTPGKFLPAEGRMVEWSEYWNRRLLQGDVHEAEAPAHPD